MTAFGGYIRVALWIISPLKEAQRRPSWHVRASVWEVGDVLPIRSFSVTFLLRLMSHHVPGETITDDILACRERKMPSLPVLPELWILLGVPNLHSWCLTKKTPCRLRPALYPLWTLVDTR